MDDIIKKIDPPVDKKLGRIISAIIVFTLLLINIIHFLWIDKASQKVNPDNKIATITPTDWTLIPTKGKDLHLSIIPTNGMKLRYIVVIDGDMTHKYQVPGDKIPPHLYYSITNFWVSLNEGQAHNIGYLLCEWRD